MALSAKNIADDHASLLKRGIYTKSMVNSKCQIAFGLRHGLVTGHEEKEPPAFVLQVGLTQHDLLELWGRLQLSGTILYPEEARQILSEKYDARMKGIPEEEKKVPKDELLNKLLALYMNWLEAFTAWRREDGDVVSVEKSWGYDGSIKLGGIPIAGNTDLELQGAIYDFKVCGSRSDYRKSPKWAYEMAHYSALTGKTRVAYIPMIHDLKKGAPVERNLNCTEEAEISVAAEKLQRFDAVIRSGNEKLLQPPGKIGGFPCHPKYCGYFGKQCPVTKNLKREDFLNKKEDE